MATTILDSSMFPDIRAILATTIDEISDFELSSVGIMQVTNAFLQKTIPDYSVLTGNDQVFAKAAAIFMAAAACTQFLRLKRAQQIKLGDYEESNARNVDFDKWRDYLLAQASAALVAITTLTSSFIKPVLFSVGGPTSSGQSYPENMTQWFTRISPMINNWFLLGTPYNDSFF